MEWNVGIIVVVWRFRGAISHGMSRRAGGKRAQLMNSAMIAARVASVSKRVKSTRPRHRTFIMPLFYEIKPDARTTLP